MAENTNGQLFPAQTNAGFFNSLVMLKKAPVIANRIFKTLNDAKEYAGKVNDYALPGLILTVVADGDNNGAYFVQSVTSDTGEDAELIKLSFNEELNTLNAYISGQLSALTASATTLSGDVSELQSEVGGLTNDLAEVSGSVSANTSAISGNTKDINALSGRVSELETREVNAKDVKFNPDPKTRAFDSDVTNVHNALIELDGKIVAMQTQALGITSGTAISFNTIEGPADESGNKQELIVINVNPQALVSGATGLKTNDDNTIIDVNIPGLTSNQADNMLEVKDGKLFVSKVVETQYTVDDTLFKTQTGYNSYRIGVETKNLVSARDGNKLQWIEGENKLYVPAASTGGGLSQEEVENIVEGKVNELGLTLGAELNTALSTINSYSIDEKGNVSFKQFGNSDDYPVVLFDAGEY